MIKYLGSKRLLVPGIVAVARALGGVRTAVDLFSGTSRVGHGLKAAGFQVLANDHNAYAEVLARCYVQADRERVVADAERWIQGLNRLPGDPGWFTAHYGESARFFMPRNAARIEAVRKRIAAGVMAGEIGHELEGVLLTSLMEAADRVDSTTGVQMAFLKKWAPRALGEFQLRLPDILPPAPHGSGRSHMLDALDAAKQLRGDLVYLDPPYNQHKYLGNYHVWETLVRWDQPEVYGIVNKRADCKERRSPFNSRPGILPAMEQLVASVDANYLLVSFSDEGLLSPDELRGLLARRGDVHVFSREYDRYVGARIGIHGPGGDRVGQVSHTKNHELLFLVAAATDRDRVERARPAILESLRGVATSPATGSNPADPPDPRDRSAGRAP